MVVFRLDLLNVDVSPSPPDISIEGGVSPKREIFVGRAISLKVDSGGKKQIMHVHVQYMAFGKEETLNAMLHQLALDQRSSRCNNDYYGVQGYMYSQKQLKLILLKVKVRNQLLV